MSTLPNGLTLSHLLNTPRESTMPWLRPIDREKLDKIPTDQPLTPPSTRSRTSTSTTQLLQAAGMRDHTLSGDHDVRYYTKAQIRSFLVNQSVSLGELRLGREETLQLGLTVPGAAMGSAVIITPPPVTLGLEFSIKAAVDQVDRVIVALTNTRHRNFFGGSMTIPAGVWQVSVVTWPSE